MEHPQKPIERIAYAKLLANMMDSKNHDLLFVDESSFHSWLAKDKAWSREDQVIEVPLNKL